MKSKITFLLTSLLMLLLGVGSSHADVGDVVSDISQISPTKCYTITAVRGSLVANNDGTQGVSSIKHGAANENASTDADAAKWGFLLHDGSYYLYNVKTQTVYGQDGVLAGYLSNGLELKALASPTGDYKFKFMQGENTLNNNQTGIFVIDAWSLEDDGNKLAIVEAGDFTAPSLDNLSSVTFNYQNASGVTVESETIENCISGATINSTRTGLWGVTINTPSTVATGEDQTINTGYTLAEGYPLKFGTTVADAPKYLWRINRNPAKHAAANSEQQISNSTGSFAFDADHAFCFVGSPLGFKVYSAGSDTPYGPSADNSAKLTKGDEGNAATFVFARNESNGQNLLRDVNNSSGWLNDTGGKMGYWITNLAFSDPGSSFSFIEYPTQFEVDGLRYVVKGEYSNEVYVTYKADTEPMGAGQNAYTGDIVVPATVTYEGAVFNVTEIGFKAFAHSTVTSIVIGDNVTTTRMDACANIPTLKSLTLGANVTNVDQGLCYTSSGLKEVILKPIVPPTAGGYGYLFTNTSPTFYVKASSVNAYKAATFWPDVYTPAYEGYQFNHEEMQTIIAEFEPYMSVTPNENPGYYGAEAVQNITNAINSAKALAADATIETTTQAVMDIKNACVLNTLKDGGYYMLVNDNAKIAANGKSEKAMFSDANAGLLKWGQLDANDAKFIFQVKLNEDGTFTMRNVGTGLYAGGSNRYCGAASATVKPEYTIRIANMYGGNGSHYLKTINIARPDEFSWCYCAQGNPEGTNDGPGNIFAYNGDELAAPTGGAPYKEWTWQFRTVSEESVNEIKENSLEALVAASAEKTTTGDPNTYTEEFAKKYNKVLAAAKKALDSGAGKAEAYTDLVNVQSETELNDIVDGGIYYIVTAGNGPGYNGGPYNYENKKALYNGDANVGWTTWNKTDKAQMYTFTKAADGNWYVQNLATQSYIKNPATQHGAVEISADPTTTQTFTPAILGSGKFAINANAGDGLSYCFSMALGHNGSADESGTLYTWGTTTEAISQYKVNQWYVYPVSPDVLEGLSGKAKYYNIAEEPSTPEPGKTYIVKNAYNNYYLNEKGIANKYSRLSNAALWSIEATDRTVDEAPVYILKSEKLGGYWQYDDFATLSGEGGLLDGYDVYNYAGLNARIGEAATAQGFTVLAATAAETPATRSSVNTGQDPKGFVLTAEAPVEFNGASSLYKLDTQRETNAALDPYNATVGWLFYEATLGTDLREELALAKAEYAFETDGLATGTTPGLYNAEKIAAYNDAVAAANALTDESGDVDIRVAINNLARTYADAIVVNPIVEGYYYVITAGHGPGYYTGATEPAESEWKNDEGRYALYNANGVVNWKMFDGAAPEQMYYLSPDPANNGNWFMKSLGDNTYINKGTGAYSCDVTTSAAAETSQIVEPTNEAGKFSMRFNGNAYVYSLTPSHDGSKGGDGGKISIWGSAAEAAKFKMNVFSFRPVSNERVDKAKEKLSAGLGDLIAKIESENIEGSDLPGYYAKANVEALNAAVEAAKAAVNGSGEQRFEAFTNLKTAYNKATTEFTPITEGYYYVVSKYAAYKETHDGKPAAMFTAPLDVRESGLSNVRFNTFDENNANYIFKITPKDGVANAFYVQNAYNNYYLNTGDGNSWYGEVTTCSENAVNAQLFQNYGIGQYWVADETDTRVSRCVRANGAKSGTIYGWTQFSDVVPENQTGYNAWELIPVAADKVAELIAAQTETDKAAGDAYAALDAYVGEIQTVYDGYLANEDLKAELKENLTNVYKSYTNAKAARNYDILAVAAKYNDIKKGLENAMDAARVDVNDAANYYIIAEEPSAPAPGKTYLVKNAYNNLYLSDKGIGNTYSRLNNAALWSIEATERTADEAPVYLLKSEKLGGYWQYDDFAALTPADVLYDGYDVYNYAGLNARIGEAATAQGFTVLAATAAETPATRSSVNTGQDPKGFVLTAEAPVVFNGASSLYKLDTQRETNAALDPYNATVGWLFYEATLGTDLREELALAKAEYALNLDDMTVGDNPGFYNSEKIAAYTSALETVNAIGDESTNLQIRRAIDALAEAYTAASVPNPIVEGYYYVISAGKGTGYYAGNDAPDREYNDEGKYALFNGNGNVGWKSYNSVAPEQMYYFTEDPANPGNWFLKNLGDNTYFNKGTAQYTCNVTTSTEAETSQIFENSYAPGKFTMRYNGNAYVYSLTPSHNGQVGANGNSEALDGLINIWGTAAEAAKFKMNVYYIRPVSEANLEAAKEKLAEGLEDLIAKIEGEEIEGSDLPGYYSQDNVAALDAAIESAKGLTEASADERLEALANLKAAYNKATTEFNPITEGYYYVVSKYAAYKEANDGKPAAMFTAPLDVRESGLSNVRFDTFDENNANYIFKITPKDGVANAFYVQNAYNDYYLNTGDGNSWYGEVTTCSENAVNAQLFQNYGVGQYWVADETDNRVSRCVRTNGVKNGTIYGWTTIADVISENQTGYNAWELVPVAADKVAELIAAQTETDKAAGDAYTALNTYVEENQETYDSYVANTELSEELKTALTDAYKGYTDAKGIRNFDIFATAEKYNAIKAALEEAMKAAHDEINGINGIAAGGNAAVTVGNGGITVTASEATTIKVVSAAGAVVAVKNLEAGETATFSLLPGVYVVNGKKVMVK